MKPTFLDDLDKEEGSNSIGITIKKAPLAGLDLQAPKNIPEFTGPFSFTPPNERDLTSGLKQEHADEINKQPQERLNLIRGALLDVLREALTGRDKVFEIVADATYLVACIKAMTGCDHVKIFKEEQIYCCGYVKWYMLLKNIFCIFVNKETGIEESKDFFACYRPQCALLRAHGISLKYIKVGPPKL
jgi:hypothetical protein